MSCVSDWQNRSCFVWVVERPQVDRPRHSPKFTVRHSYIDVEFYLKMSSSYGSAYHLDAVYCKGAGGDQYRSVTPYYSVSTTVHVENKEGLALPLSCKRNICYTDNRMWCCTVSEIVKYIPNFLTEGVLVFLVTFPETQASYTFEIKPPKDPSGCPAGLARSGLARL